ncbi:MAG TPA: hypothetical protein VMZ53_05595 [Kofleriaceae bacterium]|nr:hypothetical protein [Kofleriaceae bacterium]
MKRRLLISLIAAGAALGSGVASANASYWAQEGLLLEVSADPRDGSDFVQTNPVHAQSLELVALNDNVRLRGMTVRFTDGRTFSQDMRTIRAGEHVRIDLPENCGTIQGVQLDYGQQLVDRTTARLQIIPREDRQIAALPSRPVIRDHRWSRHEYRYIAPQPAYVAPQPTYVAPQPTYSYQQPTYTYQPSSYHTTPTYVVPAPRPQSSIGISGYIQGSFRF